MKEIASIYNNNFGMSFYWKNENEINYEKIQVIFKETGFYLNLNELKIFGQLISQAEIATKECKSCACRANCERLLLKTPLHSIDLAVSRHELIAIKDLIEGSLFKINLQLYAFGIGRN